MNKTTGATDTQKTILLALAEGWRLRLTERGMWCLFQPMRNRPFAQLKTKTIEAMTRSGWLNEGMVSKELNFRPEKILTPAGRRYAERLITTRWAECYERTPFDAVGEMDQSGRVMPDSMAA
jgi:hypothetical protein